MKRIFNFYRPRIALQASGATFFLSSIPLFISFLVLSTPLLAEDEPFHPGEPLRIGTIHFDRRNIFQDGTGVSQKFPYSWANALHIVSKERFIRNQLLFREGDVFDLDRVLETERVLRSFRVFRYATVRATAPVNGLVDVYVVTEDVWTTSIQLAYGTAGGEDSYRVGVLERNFLGFGVEVGGFLKHENDRNIRGFTYRDPNLLNTPLEFFYGYGEDEKGREYEVSFSNPFDSALDMHAEGVDIQIKDDEARLYENGDEVATFREENENIRTFAEFATVRSYTHAHRLVMTHIYAENRYSDFKFTRPLELPQNKTVSAVLVGGQHESIDYVTERAVLTFDRDEDINLGWEWRLTAGPSLEGFGATEDEIVTENWIQKNWILFNYVPFFSFASFTSRYDNRIENGRLLVKTHAVFREWFYNNTITATTKWEAARRLDAQDQLLIGGESGLRGYSSRQFTGNKTGLISVENRQVVAYDWLRLVTVGWAVFYDGGAAWKEGDEPSFDEWKNDVGFGIRFAPSRSVNPSIIRADIAYALNDNDRDSRWVFHIGGDVFLGGKQDRKFEP